MKHNIYGNIHIVIEYAPYHRRNFALAIKLASALYHRRTRTHTRTRARNRTCERDIVGRTSSRSYSRS